MSYKLIDGVLYKETGLTAATVQNQLNNLEILTRSARSGIKTCKAEIARQQEQIKAYEKAIADIVSQQKVDIDAAKAVDATKANDVFGFLPDAAQSAN